MTRYSRLVIVCVFSIASPEFATAQRANRDEPARGGQFTSQQQRRAELLSEMRRRAGQITVTVSASNNEPQEEVELREVPLMRYTDEPRRIADATLWAWGSPGRPRAVCKIEGYDRGSGLQWLINFSSLSTELVAARWSYGPQWSARKPALELVKLPDAPEPAGSKPGRLRQIRSLARRFRCALFDDPANKREEMRLLPTPLLRYEDPARRLVDGALFAFGNHGTNPAAVFVIELHETQGHAQATWKFAFSGLTQGRLSAYLDDRQVWSKPWTHSRGAQETWIWFYEPVQ